MMRVLDGYHFMAITDAVLEYFLEVAMNDFVIGRVDQIYWHPDYHSHRVVMYILVRKQNKE